MNDEEETEQSASRDNPPPGQLWPSPNHSARIPARHRIADGLPRKRHGHLETAQPAYPGLRTYAFLADAAILFGIALIISEVVGRLIPVRNDSAFPQVYEDYLRNLAIIGILTLVAQALYNIYFLTLRKGQTPGKALLRLRIVKLNGQRLSVRDALLRNLIGYALSAIVMATGFMWAFWDAKRQTWHDKLVGTIVVRDPEE